jgi:hypothetical protein
MNLLQPFSLVALSLMGLMTAVPAAVIVVANPGQAPEIGVRARNGLGAAEVQMFDVQPTVQNVARLNPTGSPVWTYGHSYPFQATWNGATGALSFSVDFGKSGTAGDVTTGAMRETVTHVYPEFVGTAFESLALVARGRNAPAVSMTLSNLVFNGSPVGNLTSAGNAAVTQYYGSDVPGEAFAAVTLTGEMTFSGDGTVAGRPQMEFLLAGPVVLTPIPEPSLVVLGSMAACCYSLRRRRFVSPS